MFVCRIESTSTARFSTERFLQKGQISPEAVDSVDRWYIKHITWYIERKSTNLVNSRLSKFILFFLLFYRHVLRFVVRNHHVEHESAQSQCQRKTRCWTVHQHEQRDQQRRRPAQRASSRKSTSAPFRMFVGALQVEFWVFQFEMLGVDFIGPPRVLCRY